MNRLIKTSAIACIGFVLSSTAILAANATTSLNVRSGPNSGYHVVDVLHPGEHVNVKTCKSNGWCLISHPGPDGWVSSRYLTNSAKSFSHHVITPKRLKRRVAPNPGITIQFGTGISNGFGWAHDCIWRHGKRYCR